MWDSGRRVSTNLAEGARQISSSARFCRINAAEKESCALLAIGRGKQHCHGWGGPVRCRPVFRTSMPQVTNLAPRPTKAELLAANRSLLRTPDSWKLRETEFPFFQVRSAECGVRNGADKVSDKVNSPLTPTLSPRRGSTVSRLGAQFRSHSNSTARIVRPVEHSAASGTS
jgi:hypothetical protein